MNKPLIYTFYFATLLYRELVESLACAYHQFAVGMICTAALWSIWCGGVTCQCSLFEWLLFFAGVEDTLLNTVFGIVATDAYIRSLLVIWEVAQG